VLPLHLIVAALFGWLEREQRDVIEFLREENRVLKMQLQGRRLRLNDDERRRLAVIGQRLGRRILADVATIVTPDTILRWHRELIARKWTHVTSRPGRPGVQVEIRRLVVRMATDNPSWGYTRIQGALKNLGHRVARSTIAKILKEEGIPPSRERPMTWRTFLRAHWHALLAADFFTTEVWTVRGLVTYYTVFVIELHAPLTSNRGARLNAATGRGIRHSSDAPVDHPVDGVLRAPCMLICDRDRKWSAAVERFLATAGIRVLRTPLQAPNCNAYAERFVRSIKEECLNRVIPLGERHLRRTLAEFVAHYHGDEITRGWATS
jgi:transposase InsO family protein